MFMSLVAAASAIVVLVGCGPSEPVVGEVVFMEHEPYRTEMTVGYRTPEGVFTCPFGGVPVGSMCMVTHYEKWVLKVRDVTDRVHTVTVDRSTFNGCAVGATWDGTVRSCGTATL
jgi:hypothetical protein